MQAGHLDPLAVFKVCNLSVAISNDLTQSLMVDILDARVGVDQLRKEDRKKEEQVWGCFGWL